MIKKFLNRLGAPTWNIHVTKTTNGNSIDYNTKSKRDNNNTVKISAEKDHLNVSLHVEDDDPIRNSKRHCRSLVRHYKMQHPFKFWFSTLFASASRCCCYF